MRNKPSRTHWKGRVVKSPEELKDLDDAFLRAKSGGSPLSSCPCCGQELSGIEIERDFPGLPRGCWCSDCAAKVERARQLTGMLQSSIKKRRFHLRRREIEEALSELMTLPIPADCLMPLLREAREIREAAKERRGAATVVDCEAKDAVTNIFILKFMCHPKLKVKASRHVPDAVTIYWEGEKLCHLPYSKIVWFLVEPLSKRFGVRIALEEHLSISRLWRILLPEHLEVHLEAQRRWFPATARALA